MELTPLRYFFEVAKTRNFTRAARNCHVAQPALSQQIKRLETLLGVRLLHRLPRGAALTAEGEALLPHIARILNAVSDAETFAAGLRGVSRGTVRIVSLPSACVYVLPPRIAAFKQAHPQVDIVLEESIVQEIPELVRAGKFDLGVTQARRPIPGLTRARLHEDELLLAVPSGHPLAARERVELREAAGERFVVTRRGTEFRTLAAELCERAGFQMQAAFEADHFDSLQAYCAVGMGVALIPAAVVLKTLTPAPRYLHISRPEARRTLWLLWSGRGLQNKTAEAMVPYLLPK